MKYIHPSESTPGKYEHKYTDTQGEVHTIMFDLVYKDASGNSYYQFINPLQMSKVREIADRRALMQCMYGLTTTGLLKGLKSIQESNQKGDTVNVSAVATDLEQRINNEFNEDAAINLAAVHFIIEGENPAIYEADMIAKKKALWAKDDAARDFFLSMLKGQVADLQRELKTRLEANNEAKTAKQSSKSHSVYTIPSL